MEFAIKQNQLTLPYVKENTEKIAKAWNSTMTQHGLELNTSVGFQAGNELNRLLSSLIHQIPQGKGSTGPNVQIALIFTSEKLV